MFNIIKNKIKNKIFDDFDFDCDRMCYFLFVVDIIMDVEEKDVKFNFCWYFW